MRSWLASILLLAIAQSGSSTQPSPRYRDSPQPGRVSRMHITESVSGRFLVKKVAPDFPAAARAAGVEGDVAFRIVIGRNGTVKEIHLRSGKPLLIAAAAKAVSQWQYEPYMFNGQPVEVETFATVRFRLSRHRCNVGIESCHLASSDIPAPATLNPGPGSSAASATIRVNGMLTAIWASRACCARFSWWTCFRD
jgi:TonB family protein